MLATVRLRGVTIALIEQLFLGDPRRMSVLQAARTLDLPDWAIAAGYVRSAVWDHFHDLAAPTVVADVDVVYFDPSNPDPAQDANVERRLRDIMPGVPWEVRNQARMHERNRDRPYRDTEDALSFYLETATTIGVRLERDDRLTVLAPWGIGDLMALRSRPTPRGREKFDDYLARMRTKNWPARWPKLRVEGL